MNMEQHVIVTEKRQEIMKLSNVDKNDRNQMFEYMFKFFKDTIDESSSRDNQNRVMFENANGKQNEMMKELRDGIINNYQDFQVYLTEIIYKWGIMMKVSKKGC
jgi:hypothetical protein